MTVNPEGRGFESRQARHSKQRLRARHSAAPFVSQFCPTLRGELPSKVREAERRVAAVAVCQVAYLPSLARAHALRHHPAHYHLTRRAIKD